MIWAPLLLASAACYLIKLSGLSLPKRFLSDARIQRTVPLLPIALLAALIVINTFSTGAHLVLDARAAALAVAGIAVMLRLPFLLVVAAAAATAAVARLL
jgi:uncharacterized membrane protein